MRISKYKNSKTEGQSPVIRGFSCPSNIRKRRRRRGACLETGSMSELLTVNVNIWDLHSGSPPPFRTLRSFFTRQTPLRTKTTKVEVGDRKKVGFLWEWSDYGLPVPGPIYRSVSSTSRPNRNRLETEKYDETHLYFRYGLSKRYLYTVTVPYQVREPTEPLRLRPQCLKRKQVHSRTSEPLSCSKQRNKRRRVLRRLRTYCRRPVWPKRRRRRWESSWLEIGITPYHD